MIRSLILAVLLVFAPMAQAASALKTGLQLPPVTLKRLDGTTTSLAALRGKPAIVTIWATWCTACLHEMPGLHAMAREWGPKGLRVVPLSIDQGDDAAEKVTHYLTRRKLTGFDVLLDEGQLISSIIGLQATPTTLILDKHGRVKDWVVGLANWTTPQAREYLTKLIAE